MNYIVNDIGTVVDVMKVLLTKSSFWKSVNAIKPNNWDDNEAPFYLYGHRLEINNRLKEKGKNAATADKKYPLVALRMDIIESWAGDLVEFNLNVALLTLTNKSYTTEQRYNNVFKPVLYPIYAAFMESVKNVGLFVWDNWQDHPPHEKIDRPYWGTIGNEGNIKNFLDDPIDAIELTNLKLRQEKSC